MAFDDYGNEPTEPIPPPVSAPAQGGGTSPEDRKAQIVNGIILPYYQSRAGRAPTQSEIDSDYEVYERHGGDIFRQSIDQRFPAQGADWFTKNAPGFGGAPSPFGEQYTAGTYTPPTFQEKFQAPTAESLTSDPGYLARMEAGQRGFERSAAAKGSILSGGFVGRTLPGKLGELASNEYSNAFGRAFDTYRQKYGEFSDSASREANAFSQNEVGKLNQFQTRYGTYKDLVAARRQAEVDRWNREMDLSKLGSDATVAGAPR